MLELFPMLLFEDDLALLSSTATGLQREKSFAIYSSVVAKPPGLTMMRAMIIMIAREYRQRKL